MRFDDDDARQHRCCIRRRVIVVPSSREGIETRARERETRTIVIDLETTHGAH